MGQSATIKNFWRRGEARLFGTNDDTEYISHRAPATVTTSYDITWPAAAPAGDRWVKMDASGVVSFATSASGDLDDAYNLGSVITADAGPLEVGGAGGIMASHTNPFYLLETTGAQRNWRVQATTGNLLNFERGDTDADATDDTFDTVLSIDGSNRRVGIHAAPSVDLEVDASGLGLARVAAIRVGSEAGQDSSIQIYEDSTARWEIGYDDSSAGLAIGRQFINTETVMFFEDVTGRIGIGSGLIAPQAHVDITADGSEGSALYVSQTASANDVVQILSAGSGHYIDTDAGAGTPAHLTNGGVWTDASCFRRFKRNIEAVDPAKVLAGIREMRISRYFDKADRSEEPRRRFGPFQDDLVKLFGLDPRGVSAVEVAAIALAGVKALALQRQ